MLSTDDVKRIEQAVGKLLDKKIEPLNEKILDLEDELKDHKSDITSSILTLRVEMREDFTTMKRRIREFKEEFNAFMKHFDSFLQDTRKDVARIKSHLKLPPIS